MSSPGGRDSDLRAYAAACDQPGWLELIVIAKYD
jgi:hypothetical protein